MSAKKLAKAQVQDVVQLRGDRPSGYGPCNSCMYFFIGQFNENSHPAIVTFYYIGLRRDPHRGVHEAHAEAEHLERH